MDLADKGALVTGAARRVGRAIALQLADAGCHLAVHYRTSKADAISLRDRITATGRRCCLVRGDLADPAVPGRVIGEAVEGLGGLNVLVNNACVFGRMALEDFDHQTWQRELQVNLTAVVALCHHARSHLERDGGGKIVNLCDISAERPWKGYLAYCVSK
ncbi:MAG: SDR family NAD(P)-dependent oxidoreductase, partial [Planctomycetales bacterium]|nr:SDR family NAD(P)-dependent oxidoreductase [Planctomycetales bacterium]